MRFGERGEREAIARLLRRDGSRDPAVQRRAARIVADVRRRGDRAVRAWQRRLGDGSRPLELSRREMHDGWRRTPAGIRAAIRRAARHVRIVAERQRPRGFVARVAPGIRIEQHVEALASAGCYVPGGRHPLPSTLVMTATPAAVAGVKTIVAVCPNPTPEVLCAAVECGVSRVFRVGGAQAIAALAYGTASIPPVHKIVGPGNAWVAAAKQVVAADVAVDAHAGPSEIIVWADEGNAEWIAADLVAQAEHDPDVRAVLVTRSSALARAVAEWTRRLTEPRSVARRALARNGAAIIARSRAEAAALVTAFAPEHLVCGGDVGRDGWPVAGTIFAGPWSVQAAGDYLTGSNHVLPTGGWARVRGPLGAADFVRVFNVQRLTARGLRGIADDVMTLAGAEGLDAHAASIRRRLEAIR
jgi:histidinol dehydrogenase